MEAKAVARYVRISPRKARQVIDLIRGKSLAEALAILRFTPKHGSRIIEKVVTSAAANAENNHNMNRDLLYVASAFVDQGSVMKRFLPRSRGRADRILKRTSHITIGLKEREG
jgi:large subunit ribosomal protein L22